MHIHNQMNPVIAANFNGSALSELAEANRRAADTRRKLALGASQNNAADSLNDDETFMVGRWLADRPHDSLPGDEYQPGSDSRGKDLA